MPESWARTLLGQGSSVGGWGLALPPARSVSQGTASQTWGHKFGTVRVAPPSVTEPHQW